MLGDAGVPGSKDATRVASGGAWPTVQETRMYATTGVSLTLVCALQS